MLLKGTAIVSALTLVSRALGFIRDLLVARSLGTSWMADAFLVAFRIPNLLRSFVAEGALTSAFVPVFSSALNDGEDSAQQALGRIAKFLLLVTTLLAAAGCLYAPDVVELLAPGFAGTHEKFTLCVELTRIMMPYIICISFIAMVNSALNAKGIFGASAWAQVVMNAVLIMGGFLATFSNPYTATRILSWSVLAGGIVQLIAQYPACKRASLSLVPRGPLLSPEVRSLLTLMLPAIVGASVYQLTVFFGTLLASLLGEGSVSWLFFADRIAQFPIGIFSIALASVLLPTLSKAAVVEDTESFSHSLAISVRYTTFVILPMSVMLWAMAYPIVAILFQRGAFSSHSSEMTAAALQALAVGLWAVSVHSMVVRAFIAKKDTVTPTVVGCITLVSNFFLSLLLMGPLSASDTGVVGLVGSIQQLVMSVVPWHSHLGHVGIALASSISSFISLIVIVLLYRSRVGVFPGRVVLPTLFRSVIASFLLLSILQIVKTFELAPLIHLVVGGVAGAITYLAAHCVLRSVEIKEGQSLIAKVRKSRARAR